jgi:uncharacterized protein YjdB
MNQWSTESESIASVQSNGVVWAHRLGKTTITVTDANNQSNSASIEVEVAEIKSLTWVVPRKELVVEVSDTVALSAKTHDLRTYHNCTSIFVEWGQNFNELKLLEH